MKLWHCLYVVVFYGICSESAKVKHLKGACKKTEADYSKCILNKVEYNRNRLIHGIPKLNFPGLDPFKLPFLYINHTISNFVRLDATMKNIKVTGGANTKIEHIKFDPHQLTGEILLSIPLQIVEMEYNGHGAIIIPVEAEGIAKGKYINTQVYLNGSLKTVDRVNGKYYQINKLTSKIRIGDSSVEMVSKNPDQQFVGDLITSFYNRNPLLYLDAIYPIFIAAANNILTEIINQILDSIPASEWIPEN